MGKNQKRPAETSPNRHRTDTKSQYMAGGGRIISRGMMLKWVGSQADLWPLEACTSPEIRPGCLKGRTVVPAFQSSHGFKKGVGSVWGLTRSVWTNFLPERATGRQVTGKNQKWKHRTNERTNGLTEVSTWQGGRGEDYLARDDVEVGWFTG